MKSILRASASIICHSCQTLFELVNTLNKLGWKTAIASGGFTYFSDYLKDTLDLHHAQSNTLEIVNGKLTGEVLGDVVSAQTKADILVELAEEYELGTA